MNIWGTNLIMDKPSCIIQLKILQDFLSWYVAEGLGKLQPQQWKQHIMPHSLIKRFGDFDEFILVDLHGVDIDQYRADSIHLMPEGNKYISEIIASKLLESYDK